MIGALAVAALGLAFAASTKDPLPVRSGDGELWYDEVIERMARVLWVLAWADAADEACVSTGGELMEAAPKPPELEATEATDAAKNIYEKIARAWKIDPIDAVLEHAVNTNQNEQWLLIEEWGYYAVMEALGHGVTWSDNHEPIVAGADEFMRMLGERYTFKDVVTRDMDVYCEGIYYTWPGPHGDWTPSDAWEAAVGQQSVAEFVQLIEDTDVEEAIERYVEWADQEMELYYDEEGKEELAKLLLKHIEETLGELP